MAKRTFPPAETELHAFLMAMLHGNMGQHPEFIQAPGNRRLQKFAEMLRAMGWDVQAVEVDAPPGHASRCVAVYFLPEVGFHALMGDTEEAE